MAPLGDSLIRLMAGAENEVLLVAPFIKLSALTRTLNAVPAGVPVQCVTRWEPLEILAGVSDPEIWDLLRHRPNTVLRLRMSLHGKLFRADQRCLVGSANLTDSALGWSRRPNLELLVPMSAADERITEFEWQLLSRSVVVDQSIYDGTMTAVDALRRAGILFPALTAPDEGQEPSSNIEAWLPTCRTPDRLYDAYHGRSDRMLSSAFEDALLDLSVLNPPSGLDREGFKSYVVSKLEQHPLIHEFDKFVATARTSEEVATYVASNITLLAEPPAAEVADILKRWLLTFFPDRYRTRPPEGTEIFVRGRRIS
jgi:hypothetical protein